MEKQKTLYQKLQDARVELQNMKLKKSGKNTYSNFNYYELADLLPAINVLCKKYGLFTKFDIKREGEVEMATLSIHSGAEVVIFSSPTAEAKIGVKKDGTGGADPIQNLGAKITYLRRYLLMNVFEIVENDMVDMLKKEMTKELPQGSITAIANAKDFESLSKICGELKKEYKVELIMGYYQKRKKELDENKK